MQGHFETQVDMVLPDQRQAHDSYACELFNTQQSILKMLLVGSSDDEPEIICMLSFVVMIDFRVVADEFCYSFQLALGNFHGGQCTDPDRVWTEYGAYPGDQSLFFEFFQQLQNAARISIVHFANLGKGPALQWEITLIIIE